MSRPETGTHRQRRAGVAIQACTMPIVGEDCPTANTCLACQGRRTRVHKFKDGRVRTEICSWCQGCGFMLPEQAHEWLEYERTHRPSG